MAVVVVVVTAVSAVVPVSGTVVLMMAMEMEVGSQLAERHWRDFYAGCEVHTPLLAR
jgi:hypothetical protein